MKTLYLEIKDFFSKNIKFIIIGTVVISILYTIVSTYRAFEPEESDAPSVEDTQELYADGAYFNFYVEYDDGRTFNNTSIIEQYLLMEDTLEETTRETGVDILTLFREERESDFQRSSENRGVLGITINSYSNRFSLIVRTPNQEDNLRLANYYYNEMQEGSFSFLNDKNIYYFETPREIDSVIEDKEVPEMETSEISVSSIIVNVIISLVFGFILMSVFILIKEMMSKKLNYSFTYFRDETDQFFISDNRLDNKDELKHCLTTPKVNERFILSEEDINNTSHQISIIADSNNLIQLNTIVNAPITSERAEVIIIIVSSETSRKWYKKQRRLLNTYNIPVKVIQINN